MSNTDKQPQTCYVVVSVDERNPTQEGYYITFGHPNYFCYWHQDKQCWNRGEESFNKPTHWLKKKESVYIHTPEELAQAFREVAESAAMILFDENLFSPEYVKHAIEKHLDQHYPKPQ